MAERKVTHFAKHHGQDTGSTNNGSVTVKICRIITSLLSYKLDKLDDSLGVH